MSFPPGLAVGSREDFATLEEIDTTSVWLKRVNDEA
jgi:hypothetical protein